MLPMNDDGIEGDAVASDGVWTVVIPGKAFAPGEMTRWRFVATDRDGTATKEPAYRVDSILINTLARWLWIPESDPFCRCCIGSRGMSLRRDLPAVRAGRYIIMASFTITYFLGGMDNPRPVFRRRVTTSISIVRSDLVGTKMPREWAHIDLITNWADKSKVRHVLAYEVMRESGGAAHFAHTVRVQHNGGFFSTADLVEDADETYLERAGLNMDGALYKIYANSLNKD
ncbi:MAG: hypothetical protein CM1200mP29_00800 [Verrucomicrobiota bacterium]|nr:MAG: hypothetical protein CM1200mP29_00800 [Verrucomicrobiota bacterium]